MFHAQFDNPLLYDAKPEHINLSRMIATTIWFASDRTVIRRFLSPMAGKSGRKPRTLSERKELNSGLAATAFNKVCLIN